MAMAAEFRTEAVRHLVGERDVAQGMGVQARAQQPVGENSSAMMPETPDP